MGVQLVKLINIGDAEHPSEGLLKFGGEIRSIVARLFHVVGNPRLSTKELFVDRFPGEARSALAEDAHDRCVEIAVATSHAKDAEFVFRELVSLKAPIRT